MLGRRAWWEIFHVALGVGAAALIASLVAWAYPLAQRDVWIVAIVGMVTTTVMSVPQIRRAMAADRAEQGGPR
ncbi:hypothetical protein ACLB0R_01180 [Sphingomonas sp. GlSt437]|jgi:hypothetical protein|uniref:hypothetical protein n=1 Tax=Sphingomonas sp. GlSt437 TaxID=3389970 RepID=UPI003A8718C9